MGHKESNQTNKRTSACVFKSVFSRAIFESNENLKFDELNSAVSFFFFFKSTVFHKILWFKLYFIVFYNI